MGNETNSLTNILFMDDEINNPDAYIVHQAVTALKEEGYSLFLSDSLIEQRELWATPVKDVFILDIDMNDETIRGSNIASRYLSLYNDCKIIMFSARGKIEDWFEVANRHVFGYVDKNSPDPINQLLELVLKALEYQDIGSFLPCPVPEEKKVLLAGDLDCPALTKETQEAILVRGGYTPVFCELSDMAEHLTRSDYVAVCIVGPPKSVKPSTVEPIKLICNMQPAPHVIIGVQGAFENRGFIIDCINWRPFRLLDLKKTEVENRFEQAVLAATNNYRRLEIFEANAEDLANIKTSKQFLNDDLFDAPNYDPNDVE